jgi:hypothetical protein
VCNNSPAEWISPENGWRSNRFLIPGLCGYQYTIKSREAWRFAVKLLGVILSEAASSADLGSSSKYSSEKLED